MKINTITAPEGVPVKFQLAGVGVRFGAQLLDVVLTMLFIVALVVATVSIGAGGNWLLGASALLFFFLRIPYYMVTELMWNGATLGKRMLGIRVVSATGGSLDTHAIVARNLMKEAEVFLPMLLIFTISADDPVSSVIAGLWCLMALAIPVFNKRNQRLGDMIARTLVIHRPDAVLLEDAAVVSAPDPASAFTFQTHHLEHYGAFELQTLESLLQKLRSLRSHKLRPAQEKEMASVVEAIRNRIGYGEAVAQKDHEDFLSSFYAAQRRHLEARQLFGDKRANKFHKDTEAAD